MEEIKRKYEKPAMQVYELKQQPQLLTASLTGMPEPEEI